jgi:hypothetical protein
MTLLPSLSLSPPLQIYESLEEMESHTGGPCKISLSRKLSHGKVKKSEEVEAVVAFLKKFGRDVMALDLTGYYI